LTFSQISLDEKIARVLIDVMATEAKSLAGMPRLTPKPTSPPIPGESVTCETLEEAQEYYFLPDAFKRIKHPLVRRSDLQGILLVLCPPGRRCCEMLGRRHHFPLSSQAYLQIHDRVAGLNIAVPFTFHGMMSNMRMYKVSAEVVPSRQGFSQFHPWAHRQSTAHRHF
jgi:hypothetical protein